MYDQKAFTIRNQVFVIEQHVDPDLEYDEFEGSSQHYLVIMDGQAIGTARWRETDKGIKLERFAILKEFRDKKTGFYLLNEVMKDVIPFQKPIFLHAQLRAISFYERYGFKCVGPMFVEADIEHFEMIFVVGG
ncbi:MAG: GNAT family N-acetyltransferase [Bacteroidales bacterium]|nr:GNAT family N-acetyltransferase [Bacteroidales bacterium]